MYALSAASFLCAVLLTGWYGMNAPLAELPARAATLQKELVISPGSITAKAAIIYDPTTKRVLYEKNAQARLPLASLTKLMSAEAVLSADAGRDAEVAVTADSLKPEGDWGLKVGEYWPVDDLVRFGLVASSNDAMAAAAGILGADAVTAMNARAKELGLTQTYFFNPTGLDLDVETAGAYGSAEDIAKLATVFLAQYPAFFEATTKPSVSISSPSHTLQATSTSVPLQDIPGLIGAKTGYTDLAGGNLVAAFDLEVGHPIIIAVLGSTRDGRFEDVKTLINSAREALMNQ
jgi:D-alanyl-D-alanine carboxypeptidase